MICCFPDLIEADEGPSARETHTVYLLVFANAERHR